MVVSCNAWSADCRRDSVGAHTGGCQDPADATAPKHPRLQASCLASLPSRTKQRAEHALPSAHHNTRADSESEHVGAMQVAVKTLQKRLAQASPPSSPMKGAAAPPSNNHADHDVSPPATRSSGSSCQDGHPEPGCEQQDSHQRALRQAQDHIQKLESEVQSLRQQIQQCQQRLEDAQTETASLEQLTEELQGKVSQLHDAVVASAQQKQVGTSLWWLQVALT